MRFIGIVAILLCAAGGAAGQTTPVLVPDRVSAGVDGDGDGLSDTCELALARTFAPTLVVRSGGCNWSEGVGRGRPGGGYFFVVEPGDSGVRVAFLPAYFRDCGWSGQKCWLPGVDCSPHAGDSEFILLELERRGAAGFIPVGVFLSAHCFGRSGGSCRWYRGEALSDLDWNHGAPVVWVAEGRQANYPSRESCDRGHHWIDTCDHHDTRLRFPVIPHHNLGSASSPVAPGGCIEGSALQDAAVKAEAVECFWESGTQFRGWHGPDGGVTGYWRYLSEVAQFRGSLE